MPVSKENRLIQELHRFCMQYPRTEKVLIVPDYQIGHQLLENIARAGTAWVNFHVATIASLAAECAEGEIISRNLRVLSVTGIRVQVDDIFSALQESGALKYFKRNPVNRGIVETLTKTISELRLNGITSRDLPSGVFVNSEKENDIRLILASYENALERNALVDKAGLILISLKANGKRASEGGRKYCIPSSSLLAELEREFLKGLCGEELAILHENSVLGLQRPRGAAFNDIMRDPESAQTDLDRLKWLYAGDNAPPVFNDGTVRIFHALGSRNEVREALRRIITAHTRIDDTEIIYANRECYADLLYSLCEKLEIPATFSEGIPGFLTAPGRALLSFLYWIEEDFGESYLRRAIGSGGMKWDSSDEGMVGGSALGNLLRTAGIGWGRDRYALMLGRRIDECEKPTEEQLEDEDDAACAMRQARKRNLMVLKKLCDAMLRLVPRKDEEGRIGFSELCRGCIGFLNNHVRIASEHEAMFVDGVKNEFEMAASLTGRTMISDEAVRKIIGIVSGMRINISGPRPGHLHISSCRTGGYSGRSSTFLVGLDESKFPVKIAQDPVLLDEERAAISAGLRLSRDRMAEQLFGVALLIARLTGNLTLSYSAFDIKEGRKAFPSPLVLQAFRIYSGNMKADYRDLLKSLGDPVGFGKGNTEESDLDETDFWIDKIAEKGVLKDAMDAVRQRYAGIRDGLIAEENRMNPAFTVYDGKVPGCGDELDPRKNHALVMSANRLEMAAGCPFAYFVQYVLGVKKPEEMRKEAFVWLEPRERGSLLHEVFQKFINTVQEVKGKNAPETAEKLITGILDEVVNQYREAIPPPGDAVFQSEHRQMMRDVHVFLKINRELDTAPVECEVVFGMEGSDPVTVPLAGGASFLLRGRIDRIDKAGLSEYHVWDYKTGSTYKFEERGYVAKGTQVQHCLYSVAAEQILKRSGKDANPRVIKAGYLFPTEKGTKDGMGGIIARSTGREDIWQIALDKVLDLVGKGNFLVTDADACKFCDYEDICGGEIARARMKEKLKHESNKELQKWTELKEIG